MARRLRCSFCGKTNEEVDHIMAGPQGVGICDECITLGAEVAAPASRPTTGDLVMTRIGELVTNDPRRPGQLGLMTEAAVAIRHGHITWVGAESDLPSRYWDLPLLDCQGRAVLPGFVDPHTHLVFAGDRSAEFAMRMEGASYIDIQAAGGGILSTVAATRQATAGDLFTAAMERAGRMLEHGTTTVEIKSGYGLEPTTEVTQLEVARQLAEHLPLDVVPTFLGAHQVPSEYARDRVGYLRLLSEVMMPAVSRLASYCDVFCDEGAFSVEEAELVLAAGRSHGMKPRIHANQLGDTGGLEMAVRLQAISADHLDYVDQYQADLLEEAGVVAVLLPTASWSLRSRQAPGAMLWDRGVTVAIGTDCNPGTSQVESMQLVIAVACLELGLSLEQAVWSATRGGALALEEPDKGIITVGAVADLLVLEADGYRQLGYRPDRNLIGQVVKDGDVIL
jgi:imidazolonepropionase